MKQYKDLTKQQKKVYDDIMDFFNKSNIKLNDFLIVLGVLINQMKNTKHILKSNEDKNKYYRIPSLRMR